jgi:hypothetical protein
MHKIFLASIIAFQLVCFSGCSSSPWFKDVTTRPDTHDLDDDKLSLKLSYIARYMMEDDNRNNLLNEINKTSIFHDYSLLHTSTLAQAGTDLAVGQFGSQLGSQVGLAVVGAGLVFGEIFDGSMDIVSQAYLPEIFEGELLDSQDKANKALSRFTLSRFQKIAEQNDWTFECVYGCDGLNQIFIITLQENQISSQYIYRPIEIAIKTILWPMVEAKSNDPISAMVGFPVKWKTPPGNTYLIGVFAEFIYDENGKVKVSRNEELNFSYPWAKVDLNETHLGRDILRKFHDTPYTFMGNKDVYPKLMIYEGAAYSLYTNSKERMINRVIEEQILLK